MQAFAIMVGIVSFDYFPIFDHWDVGFTETEPWSERFEWLGYESLNFLDGMGSISVFALIVILHILLATIIRVLRVNLKDKSLLNKLFNPMKVWHKAVAFIQGTFFEILIVTSIAMSVFKEYAGYFNKSDKVSIGFQFFAALILLAYVILVNYFTFVTGPKIVRQDKLEKIIKNKKQIESVR